MKFYLHCLHSFMEREKVVRCIDYSLLYEREGEKISILRTFGHSAELFLDFHEQVFSYPDLYKDEISDLMLHTVFPVTSVMDVLPDCFPSDLKKIILSYTRPKMCTIEKALQYKFRDGFQASSSYPMINLPFLKHELETKMKFININVKNRDNIYENKSTTMKTDDVLCMPCTSNDHSHLYGPARKGKFKFRQGISCLIFISDSPLGMIKEEKKVVEIRLDKKFNKLSGQDRADAITNKICQTLYSHYKPAYILERHPRKQINPEFKNCKITIYFSPGDVTKKNRKFLGSSGGGGGGGGEGLSQIEFILNFLRKDKVDFEVKPE